jgi:uncharacterized protein YjiS (DUF1127 family)
MTAMALLDFSRAPSRSVVIGDRIYGFVVNTIGAVAAWNDARRTHAVLAQLSNHELDDIGLCPGDIDRISNKGMF